MPEVPIDTTEVTALLADLVRIPSVNPRMGTGTGEGEVARYLGERLQALGLTPAIIPVHPGRPNVLVTAAGRTGGGHLLLEAHTDTVPPSTGQADPFHPRLEGGRLHGRGACDTKASVAAMLAALRSVLSLAERQATVTLAFTVGEELGHEGALALLASGFRADAAVIGEPTGLDVVVAHKGAARFKVVVVGRSAHSANPQEGVNAIGKMARVIRALDERIVPALGRQRHPLVGVPTLSVGRIEGGLQVNIVPDRCSIEIDRRLNPGEDWPAVRETLATLLQELRGEDPDLQVILEEPYQHFGSMETSPDAPVVRVAREAVRRIDGEHPVRGVSYGTDAAEFSAAGIPCVVLGPGDIAQAHTASEYVEVQQVVKAAAIYREMMLRF
jgi:succinyl-diaminopimelate desuccinylase